MTPYAITITRQFGSEGREIGKQLAERLHCHYYDRSVIEQEAAQKDESLAALVALKQVEGYYKMAYPLGIGSGLQVIRSRKKCFRHRVKCCWSTLQKKIA